ncbi:MAG: HEAT repeat domain-containing protein, partial [bacterium]|nr:HEAT repeat domain-containing protein [bacterium]
FREYLAARFLAGNSFDAIKSFTAYGHGPEYTHIKPAWANSLAFLFGILEPGNSLKKELLDWVVQKSPELVIKFERDRVPENLRVRVFKQVFEEYNRKQTSLIGAINTREMARFGDIHETVEFLIRIIEQESESRNIELKNALYLIGYMNVADNYRGRLRDALFAIIPEKSHDPYVRYIVLVALANSGFSDEETADTVVEHLRKEWDTSVRSGLYYYLSNSSGLDKHIDILLEGMSQAFANNRVDIRLGDERYFLKMGICKAAKPSALLKIIKLFSQKPDYLNSTYFRTDRKKIIQNAATAYKQEPGLLEAVFELFIVLLRDYDNIIPDLLPFFELTGTKHDVLDRIFLQKADISLYFTKALCCLADAEVIKNVLKQFDLGNLTHDELWYFQRDLNFSKAHLFEKWNKKINLKTGNPYVPPEIPDYEEEQRRRREEERDLLFQKEAFLREIKLFFSHKDELNREDISGIYHKKEDDFSDLSYNFIRRRAINAFVHKDRVLLWLEQNWDTFCIHELYELLNQDETLELSTEQREWVENWCRGHLKDVDFRRALVQKGTKFSANWPAIWLWFFRGRLKLEYPEEILLDMLSFSWVQQGQMTGIIDIIAELNPEKVRKRMFENLEKGIANHQVLLNHLFYLVENEIPGVQPFVLGEIKNPERDVHDREKILSAYMEHSGDITDIEEMLSEIDKEFFWKLVKPLASHRSEKCRSKLIDILEKGSEEDKMEAVKLLVLYEEPRALEYLIQAVQTNLKISGSPFGLPAVYDMKNIDNLPLMLSLLLTLDARASESETCSMLYSNTLKALENMALNNEDSYTMINKSLNEFLRDHEKELKTTGYLNKYLDQLEESYYAKQDRTLTIDGAISEVEKIK